MTNLILPVDLNAYVTPHFKWGELIRKGHKPDKALLFELKKTAEMAEEIRALCGHRPMTITSGWRPAWYNEAIGGAKNSYHVLGQAIDFVIQNQDPRETQRLLRNWRGGLGRYADFTHADRGPRRRW